MHDNTIYSDYLTASGIPFHAFASGEEQVDALFDGSVDAILVDQAFAAGKLAEFGGRLAIVGPSVELDMGIGIGVREDSELEGQARRSAFVNEGGRQPERHHPQMGGRGCGDVLMRPLQSVELRQ